LSDGAKLVIGRNQEDNLNLEAIQSQKYYHLKTVDITGPHGLLSKSASEAEIAFAKQAMLTYTKAKENQGYRVEFDGECTTAFAFASRNVMQAFTVV
jgi:tRNA-specific 2-thiouridylase